jgi:hypothetical protein
MEVDDREDSNAQTRSSGNGTVPSGETGQPSKPPIKLSYNDYTTLAKLLIEHLRKEEEKSEAGTLISYL